MWLVAPLGASHTLSYIGFLTISYNRRSLTDLFTLSLSSSAPTWSAFLPVPITAIRLGDQTPTSIHLGTDQASRCRFRFSLLLESLTMTSSVPTSTGSAPNRAGQLGAHPRFPELSSGLILFALNVVGIDSEPRFLLPWSTHGWPR